MNESYKAGDEFKVNGAMLPLIESLCNGMPGGFFVYKADGGEELIYFNKAMLRIFGCSTKEEFRELTGNSFRGIVHPDDYERVQSSISEQIAGSQYNLDYVEYRITRLDGSVRWVEDYGRYLLTEDFGGVFYVFIEDATERMRNRIDELERVNAELKDTHAREWQYEKAILYNAATFFEVNLTKDEFISSESHSDIGSVDVFEYMGVPRAVKFTEFISSCINRIDDQHYEEYRAFFDISRLIDCYEKGEFEQVLESSSGSGKILQFVFLIGKNEFTGDVIALSIVKDVTELNNKKRLFQAALSEATAGNIARQTFLSNLSRDIRTPMNSIRSFTEMISYNLNNIDILKYCLDKIRSSSNQLLETVNKSLELTHMESETSVLGRSECDLSDLLADAKYRILPDAAEKQINFSLDQSGIKHTKVYADAIRLQEVIWQLLDNAVKYNREGGAVTLKAYEEDNDSDIFGIFVFEVSDNGIGISKDFIGKVFEPFKREQNPIVSGIHGSGLGLAVVKNIVEMMDGSVSVKSEQGKGSSFTVSVTLHLQNLENVRNMTPEPSILKGTRVLLAEDNEINLEIERSLLEKCGCVVDTAADGKAAVEKVMGSTSKPYDIILMDIQMPVMNGYEASRIIREFGNPVLSKIPIIAVSSYTNDDYKEKAIKSGMNAHCAKPINVQTLQQTITELLNDKKK